MLARALTTPHAPSVAGSWPVNARFTSFASSLPISNKKPGEEKREDARSDKRADGAEALSFTEDELHFDHSCSPPMRASLAAQELGKQEILEEEDQQEENQQEEDLIEDLFVLEEEEEEASPSGVTSGSAAISSFRHNVHNASSSVGISGRDAHLLETSCLSAEGLDVKQLQFSERMAAVAFSPRVRSMSARPLQIGSMPSRMKTHSMIVSGWPQQQHNEEASRFVPPHEMAASYNAEMHEMHGFASSAVSGSMRHKSVAAKLVAIMHEQGLPVASEQPDT